MRIVAREAGHASHDPEAARLVTFWSISIGFAGQAALVASGPIVARLLGVEDRGYLALIMLFPTLITQGMQLGMPDAVPFHLAGDTRRLSGILKAIRRPAITQMTLAAGVGGMALVLFTRGRPAHVQLAGLSALPLFALAVFQSYGLSILQGLRQFTRFQVTRVAPVLLYASGICLLFMFDVRSLVLIMLVWVASHLAGTVLIGIMLPRAPKSAEASDVPTTGSLFRFGIRGWLGSASPIEGFRLDQAIVGLFLSPSALGLYVVGAAFSNLPRFIAQSVGMVAYPHIAAQPNSVSAARSLKRYLLVTTAICVAAIAILGLVCERLTLRLFGSEFIGAVPVAKLLLVAAVPASLRRVLGDCLRGLDHPGAGTFAEVVAWLSLIPSLAILVPHLHANGAAVALIVSNTFALFALLFALYRVQRAAFPVDTTSMEDV